jgi:hypothetical protein
VSDTQVDQPDLEPDVPEGDVGETTVPDSAPDTEPVEPSVEYLDIDDDLATKYVKVKVDGQEESVPLAEALQGYQRQADYTRSKQSLSEQQRQMQRDLQIAQAMQRDPGMAVQILAREAGVSVEDYLGMTPTQQRQAIEDNQEDEYVDPLERQIAEERNARLQLEQRLAQREADEVLRGAVNGLKQQFGIDDEQAREVVGAAYQLGLPPQMLPMVYQSMAFQKMSAEQQAHQEHATNQATEEQRRRAAAQASQQTIGQGASVNGVTGTPANQEFTNYRDAIMAAFDKHGDVA